MLVTTYRGARARISDLACRLGPEQRHMPVPATPARTVHFRRIGFFGPRFDDQPVPTA
jgi:hypothetical protein